MSQSLRKSGQFLCWSWYYKRNVAYESQSLRKSGQFLFTTDHPASSYGMPGRNPFVNQVSFFIIGYKSYNSFDDMSQSLRKSGQFLLKKVR